MKAPNNPTAGPAASRWAKIRSDIIGKFGFWLMTKVQWHAVDVPTWLAGYQQGLRQFKYDEAKAIVHAHAVVKRGQAFGLFSNRAAIERGWYQGRSDRAMSIACSRAWHRTYSRSSTSPMSGRRRTSRRSPGRA